MSPTQLSAEDIDRLLAQAGGGDVAALNRLLDYYRPFMRRVVEARMDPRLHSRIDASDVVQESQMEAARRLRDYLARRPMPFDLWLRQTAFENLLRLHRFHLGAERRTVLKEFALPDASSVQIGRQVLAGSQGTDRFLDAELARRVREGLARLSEADREVLLMRSFEGLSNQQVAQTLGIAPVAASQRFGRAVLRLRALLTEGGDG